MEIKKLNKNYGKIGIFGLIQYAPADLSEEQLKADGWLPFAENYQLSIEDMISSPYVCTGYEVKDGKIARKYAKRKISKNEIRTISKQKLIEKLGDKYDILQKNLKSSYENISKYFEENDEFKDNELYFKCLKRIIAELFQMSNADIEFSMIIPSVINNKISI